MKEGLNFYVSNGANPNILTQAYRSKK